MAGYSGPGGKAYNWLGGGESAVGLWIAGEGTGFNDLTRPFYNRGSQTYVHETAHNLGRSHVRQQSDEAPDDPDSDFPYAGSNKTGLGDKTWEGGLGYYWDYNDYLGRRKDDGSRATDDEIVKVLSNDIYTDIMSYGSYRWMSDWQYLQIRDEIQSQNHTSLNLNKTNANGPENNDAQFAVRQFQFKESEYTKLNFLNIVEDKNNLVLFKNFVSIDPNGYSKQLSNYGLKDSNQSQRLLDVVYTLEDSTIISSKIPAQYLSKKSDGTKLFKTYFFVIS